MRRSTAATLLLILVSLFPAAFAVLIQPPPLTSAGAALGAAGRITGIAALACLLVSAAVSARLPGFDRGFGGLTRLWRRHHYLGATAFLLAMAHPLLLAWSGLSVSTGAAVGFLFPAPEHIWIWAGWAALLCMMVFLAPSFGFFGPPHYQRWKGLHLLSGAAVALALVHAVPLSRALPPAWAWPIWTLFGAAAVAAFAYRVVLSRRLARHRHRVTGITPLSHDVVEITLRPEGRRLAYRAGQFVYLAHLDRNLDAGYNEEHPYTLSSAPQDEELRIGVKALGDQSRALQRITPGAIVTVEGPYGDLFPEALDDRPQLWLAGGIGITPFVARARALAHAGGPAAPVTLVYCAKNMERAYYLDELRSISSRLPGFTVEAHLFEREGPLTAAYLDRACPGWREREVFHCGPPGMYDHCRALMRANGVRHMQTEEFDLL